MNLKNISIKLRYFLAANLHYMLLNRENIHGFLIQIHHVMWFHRLLTINTHLVLEFNYLYNFIYICVILLSYLIYYPQIPGQMQIYSQLPYNEPTLYYLGAKIVFIIQSTSGFDTPFARKTLDRKYLRSQIKQIRNYRS